MSGRSNETLPEQMSQGRTAVDIVANNAHKEGSILNKTVEVVKKPFEHGKSGDGHGHGVVEERGEGSELAFGAGKKDVKTEDVEVASTAL